MGVQRRQRGSTGTKEKGRLSVEFSKDVALPRTGSVSHCVGSALRPYLPLFTKLRALFTKLPAYYRAIFAVLAITRYLSTYIPPERATGGVYHVTLSNVLIFNVFKLIFSS